MFAFNLYYVVSSDLYFFVADVVGHETRHTRIGKTKNVADVDGHECAFLHHAGMFFDDAPEKVLPVLKCKMSLVLLADKIRW